jgi:hypothetical protein
MTATELRRMKDEKWLVYLNKAETELHIRTIEWLV